jgi:WD40 repeat protein
MAVSPDGRLLATAAFLADHASPTLTDPSTDQGVRTFDLWELGTRRNVFHNDFQNEVMGTGPSPLPTDIAFSPDSSRVAALFDSSFAVWDVATHRRQHVPIDIIGGSGLAFTPDGNELLVASPGRLVGYDVATGRLLESFAGPAQGARLAFSKDGRWLFGSDAQGLTVWDGRSHRLILPNLRMPANGTGDQLTLAAVTDNHLFVGSQTALVDIDLNPARWSSLACRFAGRPLTRDEWNRYLPGRRYDPVCRPAGTASPTATS